MEGNTAVHEETAVVDPPRPRRTGSLGPHIALVGVPEQLYDDGHMSHDLASREMPIEHGPPTDCPRRRPPGWPGRNRCQSTGIGNQVLIIST